MADPKPGEEKKVVTPPQKEGEEQEVDFDKELSDLESGGAQEPAPAPAAKRGKTPVEELAQAGYSFKSTAKRIRELGGDPNKMLGEEGGADAPAPIDTSKFVTKEDLAVEAARKLARTEGELKVIMWWVRNKGMSVEDAHLLANKGRARKAISEITRTRDAEPSKGGGGPGSPAPTDPEVPELPEIDKQRLAQSGMAYDPTLKAYVGKKVRYAYKGKDLGWVTEKIPSK